MKILSFDIGSYSIKATEFEVTFGRVEIADYFIEKVVEPQLQEVQQAHETSPDEQKSKHPRTILSEGQMEAIRRILADRHFQADRLVVNFPKAMITNRLFSFPTKDRKAIQNSLTFELDDEIPFSMDEIVYDFATLSNDGTNSSVFTSVALKSDIAVLLSDLAKLGLDPDTITIDPWGLASLLKRSIPKEYEGRPICLVNMGNKQTTIHMMVGESPVLSHVCPCAGSDITRAIAEAYNLSFDQADKAKAAGAFLITQSNLNSGEQITDEQKFFSATIADSMLPMIREIKQTLMAYKSQYKLSPRAIFITGGTSLIPNMQLYLEEQLKIPVFSLSYMSRIVGHDTQLSETSEAQISTATGLALCAVKIERNLSINFRKDEFSKQGGFGALNWKTYKRPVKYLVASLAFVYMNLIAQNFILSSRMINQEEQLERSIKSVVGAVSPTVLSTYKNSLSSLKSAVNKELDRYKDVQVAPAKPQVSAFEILNKVSGSIPKDMTLDVSGFHLKDGKLQMIGLVDHLNNTARIAKALEDTKLLTEVNKDKAEEDPKTKKVKFEINAKVAEVTNVKTR